jgi:hypothetical protein
MRIAENRKYKEEDRPDTGSMEAKNSFSKGLCECILSRSIFGSDKSEKSFDSDSSSFALETALVERSKASAAWALVKPASKKKVKNKSLHTR